MIGYLAVLIPLGCVIMYGFVTLICKQENKKIELERMSRILES